MTSARKFLGLLTALVAASIIVGCATKPVVILETKGTALGIETPSWIKLYGEKGISAVQALPQYKEKYCIIGVETGINKQFVLAWADNFSAQQRIGAMLRTNIDSKYKGVVNGDAQSSGGASSATGRGTGSGDYQQEIDDTLGVIVNVAYTGAQLETDCWILERHYDPDVKDEWSDEYTAYVMYTIPKLLLNQQVALALETAVAKDSALYDITIRLAEDMMRPGADLGALEPVVGNSVRSPAPGALSATFTVPVVQ
jgi:hypothetical protein